MQTFYHCVWDYRKKDEEFLIKEGIKYEWYREAAYSWLIVDIPETNSACSKVLELAKDSLLFRYHEYSQNDLNKAEYLTIRARNMSFDLERGENIFEFSEPIAPNQWRHKVLKRKTQFYAKKSVKWGKSHIKASFSLSEYHMFCDDVAAAFFTGYKDVKLHSVYHDRTGETMKNMYYLEFCNVLSDDVICFDKEQSDVCPECGTKTWMIKTDHQLFLYKSALPKDLTFAKTQDIWGAGGSFRHSLNIISQKAYQAMKDARLVSRNLLFEPIVLV